MKIVNAQVLFFNLTTNRSLFFCHYVETCLPEEENMFAWKKKTCLPARKHVCLEKENLFACKKKTCLPARRKHVFLQEENMFACKKKTCLPVLVLYSSPGQEFWSLAVGEPHTPRYSGRNWGLSLEPLGIILPEMATYYLQIIQILNTQHKSI